LEDEILQQVKTAAEDGESGRKSILHGSRANTMNGGKGLRNPGHRKRNKKGKEKNYERTQGAANGGRRPKRRSNQEKKNDTMRGSQTRHDVS